jgi:hypothetical protein
MLSNLNSLFKLPPSTTVENIPPVNNLPGNNIINEDIIKNIKLIKKNYINRNLLNNLIESNSTPNNLITINNQTVLYHCIYISVCLLLVSIILILTFLNKYPNDVNISHILIENFILFGIIGYIEYWFFTTYAFKYSPLLPSELLSLINESVHNEINTEYKYTDSSETPLFNTTPIPIIYS